MRIAVEELNNVFRGVFTQRPRMRVSEWADRHRELVMAEGKGKWVTDRVPYLRGVMDSVNEPGVRQVTFMKFSQGGGTEALYNQIFYIIDRDPGDMLFVYPNDRLAQRVNKRRFLPTLKACPAVANRLGPSARDMGVMELLFDRMTITFSGSNSTANLESFPYRIGSIDELDRCEPTTQEQVEERLKTFSESLLLVTGSPGLKGEGIDRQFNGTLEEQEEGAGRTGGSDQRRFWVPCPACRVYHLRAWKDVKWKGGLRANPDTVKATAWMVCPACGEKITAASNMWQLLRGVWLKRGQVVGRLPEAGTGNGERGTVETGEVTWAESWKGPKSSSHAGFHINGLYSALEPNPYGSVAAKFVKQGGEATQNWVNRVLGEPYEPKGEGIDVKALKRRAGLTGVRYGVLPAWAMKVNLQVDVQGDRMWLLYTAWGAQGKEMAPICVAEVPRREGLNLAELDNWCVKTFAGEDEKGTKRVLRPHCVFIDTGDFTDECYTAVLRIGRLVPACRGIKGEFRDRTDMPWRASKEVMKEKGVPLLLVNVNFWKDHVFARYREREEAVVDVVEEEGEDTGQKPGATPGASAYDAVADVWHVPSGIPGYWYDHITSEHCVPKRLEGRVKWVYEMRAGKKGNHLLDCTVYAAAGADAEGLRNMRRHAGNEQHNAVAGRAEQSPPAAATPESHGGGVSPALQRARTGGFLARARSGR